MDARMQADPGAQQQGKTPQIGDQYTFTDQELSDILVFLEHQNKPGAKPMESSNLPHIPARLGQGSPGAIAAQLPMQFQPHTPVSVSPNVSPVLTQQAFSMPIKSEGQPTASSGPILAYAMPGQHQGGPGIPQAGQGQGTAPTMVMTTQQNMPINGMLQVPQQGMGGIPVYHQALSMKELYNPSHVAQVVPAMPPTSAPPPVRGGAVASASAPEKPQISHSTVEKQRRDRINNLIDELRELVPPQNLGNTANEATDVKRAKHVVLSDTITLLRKLQAHIPSAVQELSKQKPFEPGESPEMHVDADGTSLSLLGLSLRNKADGSTKDQRDLPMPPKGQSANGIVVEAAGGCLLVKVNCKDRRGLLSDVISTLKGLNLEIKTAAVTTAKDGTVHDVFEVVADPSVSVEDIQCHVHACVYTHFNANEKRPRG